MQRFLDGITDGSYLGKLDLVDGFFALKVKPSQRQYLGFTLVNEFGVDEYYEFLVLPQGISTAPYIFSRFTLAITSYLRRTLTMVLFITYLDDLGWVISPWCPPLERARIMNFIRDTFLNAGWVLSDTKCIFDSNVTSLILLGLTINTVPVLTVDMSPARKTKLLDLLTTAAQVSHSTPRFKMQIGGGLQSAELCLGPTITMFLRYTYFDTAEAIGDGSNLKLWDCTRAHTSFISSEFKY